jgi:adenylate cyclase
VLGDAFQFEYRGAVEIRGKGAMQLYYLTGRN